MTESSDDLTDKTTPPNDQTQRLLAEGRPFLPAYFESISSRLETLVRFRISQALSSRMDVEDVLQEAYLVIDQRLDEFLQGRPVSAFVWMRQLTLQKLIDLQRHHFGQKRDPLREAKAGNASAALSITRYIASAYTSPSQHAVRNERMEQLRLALESMSETDQEIVAMRHFEQLSNRETAEALEITEKAASNRYIRALAQLKKLLQP